MGLKYICERAMLKQENNGIYFAGDRLIARFDPPDETRVEQNFAAIDALAQNTGLPTRFMLVPTSAYIYQDELPANAPSYDQQQLLDRASQLQQAENIPVAQALLDAREEYIYYRTDHHWTTKGAYLAYEAYMKAAGREDEILTQEELEAVKQETPDFYGTLYSQAGARFYEPDTITWYDFPGLTMEDVYKRQVYGDLRHRLLIPRKSRKSARNFRALFWAFCIKSIFLPKIRNKRPSACV